MSCFVLIAVFVAIGVFISLAHAKGRLTTDTAADLKLETDLLLAKSRSQESQWSPTWTAPKLPASLIASIWTGRLIRTAAQSTKPDPTSPLKIMTWDFRQKAPYVVAAAFLSLRDAGLIRMPVEPQRNRFDSYTRVRVERTDMALTGLNLPAIEGGLLLACLDLAHKRFRKTTQPSANAVVSEWMHQSMSHPFRWVLEVAAQEGQELGLYEPMSEKGRGFLMPKEKPVFSLDHLAACDDQVVAYIAHWHELGVSEPELQRTLLTEVAYGIYTRQERSA